MNKKLISMAVAAALVAPAAAMADATLYGRMNISIDYFDVNDVGTLQGFNGWTMNGRLNPGVVAPFGATPQSRANRFGVKGSEDLGGGLKAIYQIEVGVNATNESDNNINNGDRGNGLYMRNTFVGLAGGWGTALMGRHDTPMKISTGKLDLFADTVADMNGTIGFQDIRADNAVAYISPSFSGFTFAGAIVPGGGATVNGDGNVNSDSLAQAYSLAGIYSNGPFYGSVAYESLGKNLLASSFDVVDVTPGTVTVTTPPGTYPVDPAVVTVTTNTRATGSTWDKWRVGLGLLDWNGFTLDGIYENWSGEVKNDLWQIQAAYAFGNMQFKGMYGQSSPDNNNAAEFDTEAWALGLDYNFSKRTKAYMVYTDKTYDNNDNRITRFFNRNNNPGDWAAFSLGMMHSF